MANDHPGLLLLQQLADALIEAELWQEQPPAPAAFASNQPFFADTMGLATWLQFVFLPRCRQMLLAGQTMPPFALAPMAEMQWGDSPRHAPITAQLRLLDQLLGGQ